MGVVYSPSPYIHNHDGHKNPNSKQKGNKVYISEEWGGEWSKIRLNDYNGCFVRMMVDASELDANLLRLLLEPENTKHASPIYMV